MRQLLLHAAYIELAQTENRGFFDEGEELVGNGQRGYNFFGQEGTSPESVVTERGRKRDEGDESGTGPILSNWAVPPTSERSSPGRGATKSGQHREYK